MAYEVTIKKVTDDMHVVTTTFPNGWEQVSTFAAEHDARVYVNGMRDGINAVKNMIGIGPDFSGRVIEFRAGV